MTQFKYFGIAITNQEELSIPWHFYISLFILYCKSTTTASLGLPDKTTLQ
jgi:hypothetical protein